MIRYRIARDKALNILSMYGITEPPVDVDAIASYLGFKVVPYEFPEAISGLTRISGNSKAIGVNKLHSEVRRRFTVAHELGHYLSGHEDYSHEKKIVVEDPEKKYLDPHNQMEQEADEFAAELLMPAFLLRKDVLERKMTISELIKRYNVSEQALWIQLINLKLALEFSSNENSARI